MEGDDNYEKQNKDNKYADDLANFQLDDSMKDGIVRDRSCTDPLCLIIFLAAVASMGYCSWYGHTYGDVDRLTSPIDADLNICGITEGFEDYPYLYLTDFSSLSVTGIFGSGVCVKACPTGPSFAIDCKPNGGVASCDVPEDAQYFTISVLEYCFPSSTDDVPEIVRQGFEVAMAAFKSSMVGEFFNDMYLASNAINISIAMSVVYSFVFIGFLSAFAEQIAWICIFLIQIFLLGVAGASYMYRDQQQQEFSVDSSLDTDGQVKMMEDYQNMQNALLGATCLFGVLGVGFLCCVCCSYKSLKHAIDCIDASADFLWGTKRIIFVPILFFVLIVIVVSSWLGAMALVVSLNKIEVDPNIPQLKIITWEDDTNFYMAMWMLFGVIWIASFLEYCSSMVLYISVATYYFNSSPEGDGSAEVGFAIQSTLGAHAGTVAFASFIIAVIRFIKIVFIYMAKQAEKQSGDNAVVKLVVRCALCILQCLEKICDYINESAMAYSAASGKSFCVSAWEAFLLQVKHVAKFSFAALLAKIFVLLGKLAITVGNCFSLMFIMKNVTMESQDVGSIIGPVGIVAVFTFLTASVMLGMFDSVVLGMLTCLSVDMDLNGGEPKRGPVTFHDSIKKSDETAIKEQDSILANEMA